MTYFSTILNQSENRHWKEKWKKKLKNLAHFFSISDKSEILRDKPIDFFLIGDTYVENI